MGSADCITGTSVGQLDEVVENAEQTDFWRATAEKHFDAIPNQASIW